MLVQNPPSSGSVLYSLITAIFLCGGWPRFVFLLPNKYSQSSEINHKDHGNVQVQESLIYSNVSKSSNDK